MTLNTAFIKRKRREGGEEEGKKKTIDAWTAFIKCLS